MTINESASIQAAKPDIAPPLVLSDCRFFFDFDNTLTSFDVLDDIVQRFSVDDGWIPWERDWAAGKIGSRECLTQQLRSVRVSRERLTSYLADIELDPHFFRLLAFLKKEGAGPVIVSDSFSFFIKTILSNNGISGVKVFANGLTFSGEVLKPSFPYFNGSCSRCAHCKKARLAEIAGGKKTVYVGDGRSDMCAAEHADLVFAKSTLLGHFRDKDLPCVAFDHLGDVYGYLKEARRGTKS